MKVIRPLGSILFLALLCTGLNSARAEEAAPRDYDRFDIRLGGGWVFASNTEIHVLGSRGIGTAIDFDKTLGGEETDNLMRVDGTWRWSKKNSLTFSWYDVDRTGMKTLSQDLEFGDNLFEVGASVESEIEMDIYRLMYRYGLARTDQIDFDIGAGFYLASIKAALTARSSVGSTTAGTHEEAALTAPLPAMGFLVNCKLTQKLSLVISADWFYFKYQDWEGGQTDLQTGLEYSLARNWTLGVAYDRLNMSIEGPVDPGHFAVDNSWNALYSYLAFHW